MMTWVVFAAAEREAANAKYLREEKLKGFMKRLRARLEKLPTGPGVLVDAHSDRVHED